MIEIDYEMWAYFMLSIIVYLVQLRYGSKLLNEPYRKGGVSK